nr:MAG TPA: hypothetical protein [Caudoviricetes sp.]
MRSKVPELTVERHYTRLLRAPRHWERVRCPPLGSIQRRKAKMRENIIGKCK